MLNQPTIDKLLAMRMEPVVEAWRAFEQDQNTQALSFEEKLSLMVDRLWTWRQNLALERRLRYAKLHGNACVEDIDYRAARGLDRVPCGLWSPIRDGSSVTRTFSSSAQPASARVSWLAPWRKEPSAMATCLYTRARRSVPRSRVGSR